MQGVSTVRAEAGKFKLKQGPTRTKVRLLAVLGFSTEEKRTCLMLNGRNEEEVMMISLRLGL